MGFGVSMMWKIDPKVFLRGCDRLQNNCDFEKLAQIPILKRKMSRNESTKMPTSVGTRATFFFFSSGVFSGNVKKLSIINIYSSETQKKMLRTWRDVMIICKRGLSDRRIGHQMTVFR